MSIILTIVISLVVAVIAGYVVYNQNNSKLVKMTTLAKQFESSLQKAEQEKSHLNQENKKFIADLSTLQTERENLQRQLSEHKKEIEKLHEEIKKEFKLLANDVLKSNSQEFKQSSSEMLVGLLSPLKERLQYFQEDVRSSRESHTKESAKLQEQITYLLETSHTMAKEASNLTKALTKESKTRGDWGEMILESILSKSGLIENEQYSLQKGFKNEEGSLLKPDAVIYLPDQKNIVIDSKVQLVAYEKYISCPEEEKAYWIGQHIEAIKNHIKELSQKKYHELYKINSPDFVLMFLPIEPAFNLALEKDISLYNNALEKSIVLVTPSTLIATLKIVYTLWRQDKQNRNAIVIAKTGGDLYEKLVRFMEDMKNIGDHIDKSKNSYQEAYKKLYTGRGNALKLAEKMKELGAKTDKEIPDRHFIEN